MSTMHFGSQSFQAALPAPVEFNHRSTVSFTSGDLDQTAPQPSSIIAQSQDDIRTERVQFAPGTTGTIIEGSIQGYEAVDYILNARTGQYMTVNLTTDNGANYFTILTPAAAEVDRLGSVSQSQYQGALPASGDYRIRVYIMRNAARRNEVANYRLEMIVAD
ncbi:MAG: DNA breaking-rejoining protein [Cyanobacteria bacterium J06638_22]